MISGQYVKFALNTIVSVSVSNVARDIIKNNVEENTLRVKITTLVIGNIVFEYIWAHTDAKLENFKDWALSTKKAVEEVQAPSPSEEGLT